MGKDESDRLVVDDVIKLWRENFYGMSGGKISEKNIWNSYNEVD